MLRNYLKIAWRNLWRQKGYSAINVFGLSVGIAVCTLIALFIHHEWSHDRFHDRAEDIYRVLEQDITAEQDAQWRARLQGPMGPSLQEEFPDVLQAVRTHPKGEILFQQNSQRYYEDGGLRTESSFFEVFSFELLRGSEETALRAPDAIILTESLAEKYFGNENPVGETIFIEDDEVRTVTGVVANPPHNSQLQFSYLVPLPEELHGVPIDDWQRLSAFYTYILLQPGSEASSLESQLPSFIDTYLGERSSEVTYHLQPLTESYLHSPTGAEPYRSGDPTSLYLFGAIAALILLIAGINYVNLSTAQAIQRAQEVGIRKSVGANRGQIARQFIGEALLVATIAMVIGLIIAKASMPLFETLFAVQLTAELFNSTGAVLGLLVIAIIVGIGSGSYPALLLSSHQPSKIFRTKQSARGHSSWMRQGLVVFQFGISVALIVATAIVYQQLVYMQAANLAQHGDEIVIIDLDGQVMQNNYPAFKEELLRLPQVNEVTGSSGSFGQNLAKVYTQPDEGEQVGINVLNVDRDFAEALSLEIIEGRSLSSEYSSDDEGAALINEAAVRALGFSDPTGEELPIFGPNRRVEVVGIISDFHYASLRQQIEPLALVSGDFPVHYVKASIQTDDVSQTISSIENIHQSLAGEFPFIYSFLDEKYDALYRSEQRLGNIFGIFAALAIFIACLGLFGLATFAAERRKKEIGIRKVLGATAQSIVALLSKDFLKLVLIGFGLAAPVAYYAMSRWLEDFAYRIDIGPMVFILAGLAAGVIALLTVSYQALKAAWMNPTEAIQQE